MAPASRACGHSSAHATAHTAVPASAEPIRHRFIENPWSFVAPKMVGYFLYTTDSTKEGLPWDDKIVSNLHEQMEPSGL
jgi:hypothetical protein